MAWTTPKTWSVAEVLTAANMNTYLRDNTDWLGTSHPHCRVFNSAAISIPNATGTALTFDSESYDVGAMHSTSTNTGRITVPTGGAGVYLVGGQVSWAGNATGVRQVQVRINAGTALGINEQVSASAASANWQSIMVPYAAVAGDFFDLTVTQNSGGALNSALVSPLSPAFWCQWQST
jgi:hypothetical protein